MFWACVSLILVGIIYDYAPSETNHIISFCSGTSCYIDAIIQPINIAVIFALSCLYAAFKPNLLFMPTCIGAVGIISLALFYDYTKDYTGLLTLISMICMDLTIRMHKRAYAYR